MAEVSAVAAVFSANGVSNDSVSLLSLASVLLLMSLLMLPYLLSFQLTLVLLSDLQSSTSLKFLLWRPICFKNPFFY